MSSSIQQDNQHVITIRAGESYILKKSATIVTIATSGDATLNAPCFDTSNQESFSCYVIKGFTARPNSSSATVNGEEQYARGMYIGTQFYPFSVNNYTIDDQYTQIIALLNTMAPFKDVMKGLCYTQDEDSSRGTTLYYTFLGIPSIADKMKLFVQAGSVHTHGLIDLYYPAIPISQLQSADGDSSNLCGCGGT
jgi:hypothetical protein